jgi:poly-gamma-glutamate synthesis protein (capsule biosynthesis protein)
MLRVAHWDLDGAVRQGELVVHRDQADAIVEVFRRLFDARFPIERMQLVDDYGGDDDASMAANNTSAFNCRTVSGSSRYSEHAYGRAVDLNPRFNPWVHAGRIDPPNGAAYADRSRPQPGMVRPGDAVVTAFAAIGWAWAGTRESPDYQHFSSTGR